MSPITIADDCRTGLLLKGSDIPAGTKSITIEVAGVREPQEGSPDILKLKELVYGKPFWAVNKTNRKKLIRLFGEGYRELIGRKVKLEIIPVRNPQNGEFYPSLAVSD